MKIKELVPSLVTGLVESTHEEMLESIASLTNSDAEKVVRDVKERVSNATRTNVSPYLEQQVLTEIVTSLHGVNSPGANLLRYHAQKRILFLHQQAVQNGR